MEKLKIPDNAIIKEDLTAAQEEVLKNLRENKEVNAQLQLLKLSIRDVKNNLGTLLTYYEDNIVCQNCPGIKNCPKEHPCFEFGLTYDGKFVSVTRSPCRKANEQMKYQNYFICRDFDDEMIGKTLNDVNKTKTRNPLLIKMINLIKGQAKDWLYIRGSFNSGRTYMATCFSTTYALECSNPVAFCDTSKLIEDLKALNIKNKEQFVSKLTALQSCPLLVLDGFGNEFISEFNFTQVIYPLLSERFRKGLLTVFTSDFTHEEVIELYSSKVGKARSRQLANVLDASIAKEFVLDGIKLF